MNLLDNLYNGEVLPVSVIRTETKKYDRACKKVEKLKVRLAELIPETEHELIENLVLAVYDMTEEEIKQAYKYGFASGVELKKEVDDIREKY
jgi:hypothetical protein